MMWRWFRDLFRARTIDRSNCAPLSARLLALYLDTMRSRK
jgi:hypothetical protein